MQNQPSTTLQQQKQHPIEEEKKASKKSLKRQLKKEKWQENRQVRKIIRKQNKQKRKLQKKKRVDYLKKFGKGKDSGVTKQDMKNSFSELCENGTKIIIDCWNFQDLMNEKEKQSLYKQIQLIYAFNKKLQKPAKIYVTDPGEVVKKKLIEANGKNWLGVQILSRRSGQNVLGESKLDQQQQEKFQDKPCYLTQQFRKKQKESELVFLTADTDNTIEQFSKNQCFIIGGLVDKNRHKLVTSHRADHFKIKKAKLPVKENMKLDSSSVLTVNHVFEVIMRAVNGGFSQFGYDWKKAFEQTLPSRKREIFKDSGSLENDV